MPHSSNSPADHPDPSTSPAVHHSSLRPEPAEEAVGSPAQRAFRQAVLDVENLRQRLRDLEEEQADARRRYWQHVGPLAQAVVTARQALFPPLEEALLLHFFSRAEEQQITSLIVANAHSLRDRFGEDATEILQRYATHQKAQNITITESYSYQADVNHTSEPQRGGQRRKTKAQRAQEAAEREAQAQQQSLLGNTKAVYRQLARANHPDLERDPERAQAKTIRMQQITEAYEANDLYTLLQLLSEHSADGDAASDDLLTRYTQALHRQQTELKQRMNELKFGANGFFGSTGKKQEAELRQLKRHLRAEAEYLQHIRHAIAEPSGLRDLLKQLAAEGHESI
ncbi:hypothetical protein [Hymenobacter jejuensis]|uniref:J domain-containing protein n=1 Tax=Hymenobacter jejuensis TaxID=2502781 RepID=A0A5B8A5K0_9BACT|nr:hypothetical protein [Hymenobacter jejuensis]QDA61482.1 hypothetical protein FHG12_15860 [Hymenobacter jejuensis]